MYIFCHHSLICNNLWHLTILVTLQWELLSLSTSTNQSDIWPVWYMKSNGRTRERGPQFCRSWKPCQCCIGWPLGLCTIKELHPGLLRHHHIQRDGGQNVRFKFQRTHHRWPCLHGQQTCASLCFLWLTLLRLSTSDSHRSATVSHLQLLTFLSFKCSAVFLTSLAVSWLFVM